MTYKRVPGWVWGGLGLPLLVPVTWVVVSLTAKPLYRGASEVPVAASFAPVPRWVEAVGKSRALVRESVARQNVPGVSVAIGVGGEVVWAEGFGYADLFRGVAMTPAQRLRLGSATEMLTSVAVGALVERGGLNLDAEIQTYVPDYPKQKWPARLREVMVHTAGLPVDGGEGPLFTTHCDGAADALRKAGDGAPQVQPGTRFRRSHYGWMLASAALEKAAGQPVTALVREKVLTPLEMRDTMPDPERFDPEGDDFPLFIMIREKIYDAEAQLGTRGSGAGEPARYYFPRFAKDPRYGFHMMRMLELSCYAGGSGFVATPSDLVRFGMAVQAGKLGPGWESDTVTVAGRTVRMVGRDGELLGGRLMSLVALPETGVTVAVMSNTSYTDTRSLALGVAEAFMAR